MATLMKLPVLPTLAIIMLTVAGCGGLSPATTVGNPYANVRFSALMGYNGRTRTLDSLSPIRKEREGAVATVSVANPESNEFYYYEPPNPNPILATRILAFSDAASPEPGTAYTSTTKLTFGTDARISLTYTEPATATNPAPKVWRAITGTVEVFYSSDSIPQNDYDRVVLEPDSTVPGNAAKGGVRLSGFVHPNAPQ